MGDRCSVSIHMGGVINARSLVTVANGILKEDRWEEVHTQAERYQRKTVYELFLMAHLNKTTADLDAYEVNYGDIDITQEACAAANVSFYVSAGAGGDYGPEIRYWKPGMNECETCEATNDGPFVGLRELQELVERPEDEHGPALRKLVDRLKMFTHEHMPPVQLEPRLLACLQKRFAVDIASKALKLNKGA